MRFTKIKANDKGVQLMWSTTDASGLTHNHDVSSPEKPAPELPDALAAFVPFVMDLLDLPPGWRDQIRVTTISLNEEKETKTRGLMVSVSKKIAKASGRPVSITTPHMREATENTTSSTGIIDDDTLELIAVVERAAAAFVKGERMQVELIPKDASEPAAAEAPAENDITKARGRRGKSRSFIPGGGEVMNPGKDKAPTDVTLRTLLLSVGRDIPEDALSRWASSDRQSAQTWAEQVIAKRSGERKEEPMEEPELVKKHATPALEDGWTQSSPPPKAEDVSPIATG